MDTEEHYEQEKAEDTARYQEYVSTGRHITNENMMIWLDHQAERAALRSKAE